MNATSRTTFQNSPSPTAAISIERQIKDLNNLISKASKVFNGENSNVLISVGAPGTPEDRTVLLLSALPPEFREAFNNYAARLIAERLLLEVELRNLQTVSK